MGIHCTNCGKEGISLAGRPQPRLRIIQGRPEEVMVYHWICGSCGNRFETITRRMPIQGSHGQSWKEKRI